VQSINATVITITLGRAEAIMPRAQQIPGEKFKPHDKIRAYIMEVKKTTRGPQIVLSRGHRDMLRRLLENEVPEIYNGHVEIKSIAREAGYRSKVAVAALQEGIDPVGACVGMRGGRIQNIVKELHDEKIDVIEWNPNQEQFIAKALSPARVTGVYLEDDPDNGRTAVVIVPDDQLSLAIGKEGQNARLAAKLTGWRIDIKSVAEAVQEAIDNSDTLPVKEMLKQNPDMVVDAQRILEKRLAGRTVSPEEFNLLAKMADLIQRRIMAGREVARKERLSQINAVKSTLPAGAFKTPVDALALPEAVREALKAFNSVGDIMLAALLDERRIKNKLTAFPEDTLAQVQDALANVVIQEYEEVEEEPAPEAEIVETLQPEVPTMEAALSAAEVDEDLVVRDAFADLPDAAGELPRRDKVKPGKRAFEPAATPAETVVEEEEVDIEAAQDPSKAGKAKPKDKKKKGRQVFYDEDRGQSYVKRQRKRGGATWTDIDEMDDEI
jgi:N utilization substance protein A